MQCWLLAREKRSDIALFEQSEHGCGLLPLARYHSPECTVADSQCDRKNFHVMWNPRFVRLSVVSGRILRRKTGHPSLARCICNTETHSPSDGQQTSLYNLGFRKGSFGNKIPTWALSLLENVDKINSVKEGLDILASWHVPLDRISRHSLISRLAAVHKADEPSTRVEDVRNSRGSLSRYIANPRVVEFAFYLCTQADTLSDAELAMASALFDQLDVRRLQPSYWQLLKAKLCERIDQASDEELAHFVGVDSLMLAFASAGIIHRHSPPAALVSAWLTSLALYKADMFDEGLAKGVEDQVSKLLLFKDLVGAVYILSAAASGGMPIDKKIGEAVCVASVGAAEQLPADCAVALTLLYPQLGCHQRDLLEELSETIAAHLGEISFGKIGSVIKALNSCHVVSEHFLASCTDALCDKVRSASEDDMFSALMALDASGIQSAKLVLSYHEELTERHLYDADPKAAVLLLNYYMRCHVQKEDVVQQLVAMIVTNCSRLAGEELAMFVEALQAVERFPLLSTDRVIGVSAVICNVSGHPQTLNIHQVIRILLVGETCFNIEQLTEFSELAAHKVMASNEVLSTDQAVLTLGVFSRLQVLVPSIVMAAETLLKNLEGCFEWPFDRVVMCLKSLERLKVVNEQQLTELCMSLRDLRSCSFDELCDIVGSLAQLRFCPPRVRFAIRQAVGQLPKDSFDLQVLLLYRDLAVLELLPEFLLRIALWKMKNLIQRLPPEEKRTASEVALQLNTLSSRYFLPLTVETVLKPAVVNSFQSKHAPNIMESVAWAAEQIMPDKKYYVLEWVMASPFVCLPAALIVGPHGHFRPWSESFYELGSDPPNLRWVKPKVLAEKNLKPVGIVLLHPSSYLYGTSQPDGRTMFTLRALSSDGWRLVLISSGEWTKIPLSTNRVLYLKERLENMSQLPEVTLPF